MSNTSSPRLPEIIGAGPGRTGSTWLHRALEKHVNLPHGIKETQFFTNFYDKGVAWYARHFRFAAEGRKTVEICPCLFHPQAAGRIKAHIPNCKVITTLRNPADRTYSMYKMSRYYAWHSGTLDEVLAARPELGGANRYALHLKRWFETFGRENVLVTLYDDLRADRQGYLNQVTDFIGIERVTLSERTAIGDSVNSFERAPKNRHLARRATALKLWLRERQAYPAIDLLARARVWNFCHGRGEPFERLTPEQEERLCRRYLPEIDALEELLGIDLAAWKQPRLTRDRTPAATRIQRADDRRAEQAGFGAIRSAESSGSPSRLRDSST